MFQVEFNFGELREESMVQVRLLNKLCELIALIALALSLLSAANYFTQELVKTKSDK